MKKLLLSLLGLAATGVSYGQCPLTGPATLPYIQNFNSVSGYTQNDTIFMCEPSARWEFQSPGTNAEFYMGRPSSTGGPQSDFQGVSLAMSSAADADTANIILTIDLSNITASAPEDIWLNFYYADYADEVDAADQISVRGSNSDTWVDLINWSSGASNDWQIGRYKLDSIFTANGQSFSATTQVKFTQNDNATVTGNDGFGLDQVSIESNNTAMPTNVSISNVTATTADVSWTGSAPHTQIAVGALGFYWPSAATQDFSGVSTGSLTGLSPATEYQVWLRDSTASGDVSLWRGPFSFTTSCIPYTAPFFTDFESTNDGDVENCWLQYNSYSTLAYARVEALSSTNATQPLSGSNVLEMYAYTSFSAGDTLVAISPEFGDMTAGDKQVRFHLASNDDANSLYIATMDNNTLNASITILDTIDIIASNTWQEVIYPLTTANGYNGTDTYIALIHDLSGGTFDDIYIDDFNYEVIPACPKVTGVSFSNIGFDNADMSYILNGDSLQLEWGPAGYTQGTGCVVSVANNGTININNTLDPGCAIGLGASTTYDVYVRNNCTSSGDGFSIWSGPFSFTTACAPTMAPFTENFDSWDPGTGSTTANNDSISSCWSRDPIAGSGSYLWLVDNNGTGSSNTGPSTDNSGSGNYLYTEASSGSTGDIAYLYSPLIDVSGLSLPYVQFYLHGTGDDLDRLDLEYLDNGTWTPLITVIGEQQAAIADPFMLMADTLDNLSGTITQLRFKATRGTSFEGDWAIDELSVIETPSCTPSTAFMVDSATGNTIYTSWTAGAGTSFIINADTTGFTPGMGRYGDTVSLTNGAITGLMPSTDYDIYLKDVCGGGNGSSMWVGPINGRTACPAVYSSPVLFDLEDLSIGNRVDFVNCWSTDKTSNPRWEVETASGSNLNSTNTGPFFDKTLNGVAGGNYWFLETSGGSLGNEANLNSPPIDLSGMTEPSLYFWFHMYGADMGNLHIDIENQGTWYNDYFLIQGQQDTAGNDDWNQLELNLASFVNDTIRIRFRGERGNGFTSDMAIDDIEIAEASDCNLPVNLQATNLTATSTDITWSSYGDEFNLVWGPSGFLQGTNTAGGTVINNTTAPVSITGLNPNTAYDIYVQDTCDESIWTGPLTIQTPCLSALAGGTYTIGTSPSDDFATFDSVATLLNGCGISGPVIFNIQPGTYVDNLHLQFVPGVTSTNTITFNGTNGQDSLIYNGQSYQSTVLIEGTKYVTLNDMTIVNNGTSESFGIMLKDNSDSVTISNNTILMDTTGSGIDITAILTASVYDNDLSEGSEVDYLTIVGNEIIGAVYGINLEGDGTGDFSIGHRILNNHLSSQVTYGIYLDELQDIEIIGNTIDNVRGTTDGIYAFDLNDFRVENNAIYVSDYGLYITDGNDGFAPASRSTLINNMVSSTSDYGIYLNDFELVEVYHNTAYGSPGMAINDQDSVWVINNVFVSDNDFAFESFDNFNGSETVDYNAYESGNSNAFDIGTSSYADLAAWVAGDPAHNANSVEGDPVFISKPDDLHLIGTLANDAGDNSLGITTDIDGDTRPQAPSTIVDMGADEYTPLADDAEMVEIIAEFGCGDSATAVSVVFRNLGQNTITSLPITVDLTGGLTTTLNATYSGSLASLDMDTMLVGTYNTYSGVQGIMIDASVALSGDQDLSNDSLSVGPIDYLPYEPIGIDSSYCINDTSAMLTANPLTGVSYEWFASNNANDTIPVASGDTLAVAASSALSTYYLAYASAVDSLGTSFGGGNGQNGNVFDIMPISNIEITGFDVNLDATTAENVTVFVRAGTGVGNEASLTGWSLLDSMTVTGNGAGNATHIPFTTPYLALAGQTYSFMVLTTTAQMDYTNGTAVGNVLAQNTDLVIYEGAGISWPLSSVFTPRFWNGRIYYNTDACSDIRVPVNLTLGTDTATASFSTTGTQPTFNFDASASVNADVYTWDFGDGNNGTGVTTSHTYANNGVYTVTLTVDDTTGCSSMATDTTSIEVTIGIEENPLEQSLAVYPNPATDRVLVDFDLVNSSNATIRLMDAQGRVLVEVAEKAQGSKFHRTIDVSQLANGVYMIEIESGDLIAQRRLSVQ